MREADNTPRGAAAIRFAFQRRREAGGKALIPYIMAGDPDLGSTEKIVRALSGLDVELIELGMPFSDPLADGPVIQRAGQRALRQGMTLSKLLSSVEEMRLYSATPLIIMTYYNLFYKFGLEAFAREAAQVGVDGVIVPDLPPEEAEEFQEYLDREGLALIYLVAPTSTEERIRRIAAASRGFIYYVSRTGVTGERARLADDIAEHIQRIRATSDLPLAVGFGISSPEQAQTAAKLADGVIMGSVLVRFIEETREMHDRAAAHFLKPYLEILHRRTISSPPP